MSRERMRQMIRVSGGVNPQVKRRPGVSGGCDIDLGGATFDELLLDITDEQAKTIRDKLCLAYGLPEEAAKAIAKIDSPNRPMSFDKLPQPALDLMAYLTYRWRTAETYVSPLNGVPAREVPAFLHMLVNAGIAEVRDAPGGREWRKRVMKTSELSKEGVRVYAAVLAWGWKSVEVIARDANVTPGVALSCLKQLVDGGRVIRGGEHQDYCYQRRDEVKP